MHSYIPMRKHIFCIVAYMFSFIVLYGTYDCMSINTISCIQYSCRPELQIIPRHKRISDSVVHADNTVVEARFGYVCIMV